MAVYIGELNEQTTGRYTATMYDETGATIDGTAMTTLTLTLYDNRTGSIINSRSAQNVKNANGVTLAASGALTWTISTSDSVMVGRAGRERHTALFIGTWDTGSKKFTHPVEMDIINLTKVV
jgi:hypothetical protein